MANTYEYTGINESATVAFEVSADLSDINGKAVKLIADGIALPAAGDDCVGIVPITEDESYKKGSTVTVQVKDIGLWKAGAPFDRGVLLSADAEGLCQTAAAGQWAIARALTSAKAKGDLVKVQIVNAGKQATAGAGA